MMNTKRVMLALVLNSVFALPAAADNVRGVITKVDLDKKEVLVESRGLRMRGEYVLVFLTPETQVRLGLKAGQPADLATGRRVLVQYDLRDGKRLASKITVNGQTEATVATPAAPADPNSLSGTLRRIDFTEREIVVVRSGGKEETTLPIPEEVTITKDQKAIRFDDLKEGEQVVVKFEMRDGRRVTKSIHVGGVAAVSVEGQERPIQKVRDILKMVDELLQRAEQRRNDKP